MKKRIILLSLFVVSNLAMASWWGDLSKGERASVIATGIIATQNRYNNNYEQQPRKERKNLVPEQKVEEYVPKPNPNKPVPITNQKNEIKVIEENKYMQQENKKNQGNNDSIDLTEKDIIEIRQKIEAGAGNIIEMNDGRVIQIDDEGYPHIVK